MLVYVLLIVKMLERVVCDGLGGGGGGGVVWVMVVMSTRELAS